MDTGDLVFDLEVEVRNDIGADFNKEATTLPLRVKSSLMELFRADDTPAAELTDSIKSLLATLPDSGISISARHLHSKCDAMGIYLSNLGYKVCKVTTGVGVLPNQCKEVRKKSLPWCLENNHHVFLEVRKGGDSWVVEPNFGQYFCIMNPTPRFREVLDILKDVFVGSYKKVEELLNILCTEIQKAFSDNGMMVPPWRKPRSIMSRWLPTLYHVESVQSSDVIEAFKPDRVHSMDRRMPQVNLNIVNMKTRSKKIGLKAHDLASLIKEGVHGSSVYSQNIKDQQCNPAWLTSTIFVVGKEGSIKAVG